MTNNMAVSLDSNANIIRFNSSATKVTGYKRDEVLGKNWFDTFIPDSNYNEVMEVFTSIIKGKETYWEYTNDIKCKNGSFKSINWKNSLKKTKDSIILSSMGKEV